VIAASLYLATQLASASPEVGAMLLKAEAARSSDVQTFQNLLHELNRSTSSASKDQKEKIAYLNAYSDAFAGRHDDAIRKAQQLIATSSDVDMQYRAGALVVNSYATKRMFVEGLRQLEQTLSLIDQVKDPSVRQYGLWGAAVMYNQIGQYQLGMQYAKRLLSDSIPERTRCFAGQIEMEAKQALGTLPVADEPIQLLIDQCAALHEMAAANFVRATLARKWVTDGQRAKAINLLQAHIAEVEAIKYPRLIGEVQALLAELLLANGDVAAARVHALVAVEQGENIHNSLPLLSAYRTMYQIEQQRGDLAEALRYYRHYAEVDKAYLNEVKTRELAYQIVRQESQQRGQQIELLNRKNNLLQLQQQIDQQSAQNSRLYMLLFALLTASLGFWAYKTKRMQLSVKRMAETDALTGVCNRHHFTLLAEKTLAKSAAAGEPVALIMFDLDRFKSVNDSYGHSTGDWVLKQVADACGHFCRRIDHLGRIGGEEFAILLHGSDLKAATRVAEDCRVRISRIDSSETGYMFPITASFGVSSTDDSAYDLDKLLSHADQMLYRAKREGRNRVRAYVADLPIELSEPAADRVPPRRRAPGSAPESSAVAGA
jgi:diguanylate cyclase (GGDEF)-like protein